MEVLLAVAGTAATGLGVFNIARYGVTTAIKKRRRIKKVKAIFDKVDGTYSLIEGVKSKIDGGELDPKDVIAQIHEYVGAAVEEAKAARQAAEEAKSAKPYVAA